MFFPPLTLRPRYRYVGVGVEGRLREAKNIFHNPFGVSPGVFDVLVFQPGDEGLKQSAACHETVRADCW